MLRKDHRRLTLEITVISAEGLKKNNCFPFFSQRLRPFAILTTDPPPNLRMPIHGEAAERHHLYQTRVDHDGGDNPSWGDTFHLPIETTFFSQRYSSIYLHIFTKRLLSSKVQLGWCQIPSTDIMEGFRPAGSVRRLSYRVRARDGSRGDGVAHVAVKLVDPEYGSASSCSSETGPVGVSDFPASVVLQTAIGIPVTLVPLLGKCSTTFRGRFG